MEGAGGARRGPLPHYALLCAGNRTENGGDAPPCLAAELAAVLPRAAAAPACTSPQQHGQDKSSPIMLFLSAAAEQ